MTTLTRQTSGSLKLVGTALGTLIVRAPHAGIQYLPIEILDLVLEHLSIEEVVRISLTCHQLRKLCKHAAFWHRRWRELGVPPVVALCRPLRPEYEVIRARKMQLELCGQYSGTPRLRRIAHRSHYAGVSLLPGGRFLLVKPKGKPGKVLYYDLDDDVPVARPLITFDAPKLPGLLFASLCSSTKYEIALITIFAEHRQSRYYDGEINFWRLSLSDDKSELRVDSHSKIMMSLGGSAVFSLQGTILLRDRIEPKGLVIELVDLARSSDDNKAET